MKKRTKLNRDQFNSDVKNLCKLYAPKIDGYHYEYNVFEDGQKHLFAEITLVSKDNISEIYIGNVHSWNTYKNKPWDTSSDNWKLQSVDELKETMQYMGLI